MGNPKKQLITQAEMARRAGVSTAAITNACKPGRILEAARVGKRLDAAHPCAVKYLARHQKRRDAEAKAAAPPKPKGGAATRARAKAEAAAALPPPDEHAQEAPDGLGAYADMTLRELVSRFGTDIAFNDWLKALKMIEDINEKQLKNAERRGLLVSRSLVETHIFGLIEATNQRLLNDSPKTIAGQVRTAVKAGRTTEQIEQVVRDILGGQLRTVKAQASKALRKAKQAALEQAQEGSA